MSVYIKGMEMPKEYAVIIKIYPDGRIGKIPYVQWFQTDLVEGVQAVPVPPNGRLTDADAIWVEINKICDRRDAGIITDLTCLQQILSAVRHAPTIIPKEKADCHTSDTVTGSR